MADELPDLEHLLDDYGSKMLFKNLEHFDEDDDMNESSDSINNNDDNDEDYEDVDEDCEDDGVSDLESDIDESDVDKSDVDEFNIDESDNNGIR
ncbi:hypothetical protein RRF57_013226 [Xylaria bambusicola]|uniref:Uncharacterized protein n=1 Tax=Xylaria bambusicola TaxID=326684 RepID=A0AAN7V1F2_9PEZI